MSIDFSKLRIGDRLVRTKGGIFTKHHVIYMGVWHGRHLIAENQVGYGVRYLPLNDFLSEGTLDRIEYYNHSENSQTAIIDRVNKRIGTEYDLLSYNCEHFVNDVLKGIAQSKQIKNAMTLLIGFTLCVLAFKSNNEENKTSIRI